MITTVWSMDPAGAWLDNGAVLREVTSAHVACSVCKLKLRLGADFTPGPENDTEKDRTNRRPRRWWWRSTSGCGAAAGRGDGESVMQRKSLGPEVLTHWTSCGHDLWGIVPLNLPKKSERRVATRTQLGELWGGSCGLVPFRQKKSLSRAPHAARRVCVDTPNPIASIAQTSRLATEWRSRRASTTCSASARMRAPRTSLPHTAGSLAPTTRTAG